MKEVLGRGIRVPIKHTALRNRRIRVVLLRAQFDNDKREIVNVEVPFYRVTEDHSRVISNKGNKYRGFPSMPTIKHRSKQGNQQQ